MLALYRIRWVVCSNGERYPMLLQANGVPHDYVTLFVTTQIRNAGKAAQTIASCLSAIKHLLQWSHQMGIVLEDRFRDRLFLNQQEIESLCHHTQVTNEALPQPLVTKSPRNPQRVGYLKLADSKNRVTGATRYIRISYMADYLRWLALTIIEQYEKNVTVATSKQIEVMVGKLLSQRPRKSSWASLTPRKGLTEEQQTALLQCVAPNSANNPFSKQVQQRNYLIVWMLYSLGLRAGELLAVKVNDIDFQKNTLLITRRHDDVTDPRNDQPVVKTLDRLLPLSESLVTLLSHYVMGDRRQTNGSKRHFFLLVTHSPGPFLGQPLSKRGLTKIFVDLQRVDPVLFKDLSPHILRHTANDRFSELMDKKGTGAAHEEKMRSYLMGWKEGSGTAAHYTRRFIQNKAHEVALGLQRPLTKAGSGDEHA